MMFQVSFGDMIACDNENVISVTSFYLFLILFDGFIHTYTYMHISSNQLPEMSVVNSSLRVKLVREFDI